MASYLLKADGDFFERVDAAAGKGNRAAFIRAAVEAALGGRASGAVPKAVVKPGPVVRLEPKVTVAVRPSGRPVSRWASDPRYGEFRDMVFRSGAVGVTAAQVSRETGWTLLLVERFAEAMGSAGEMHYPGGDGRMVGVV